MKQRLLSWAFVLGSVTYGALGFLGVGCGSDECDSSKCVAGNTCIDNGTTNECRIKCDSATGCPTNYHCQTNPKAGGDAYCEADLKPIPKANGQWGTRCAPQDGIDDNPACDTANGFKCYATDPNDGEAICTLYDCEQDSDCRGGYWCATINVAPNALKPSANRTYRQTQRVCLPRDFCAPCASDVDCPLSRDGQKQRCVPDDSGATYCSPVCDSDATCGDWATCTEDKVCKHNSGLCHGDGMLCSPCRSDDDCAAGDGICYNDSYTGESFCTQKSTNQCSAGGCPPRTTESNWKAMGCATSGGLINQCVPEIQRGTSEGQPILLPGCWTRNR